VSERGPEPEPSDGASDGFDTVALLGALPLVGTALSVLVSLVAVVRRRASARLVALFVVDVALLALLSLGLARGGVLPGASASGDAREHEPRGPRPRIGVSFEGTRVVALHPGGPADQAGLRVGDAVVRVGGEPTASREQVVSALGKTKPDWPVEVSVLRGDERLELRVVPVTELEGARAPARMSARQALVLGGVALGEAALLVALVLVAARGRVSRAHSLRFAGWLALVFAVGSGVPIALGLAPPFRLSSELGALLGTFALGVGGAWLGARVAEHDAPRGPASSTREGRAPPASGALASTALVYFKGLRYLAGSWGRAAVFAASLQLLGVPGAPRLEDALSGPSSGVVLLALAAVVVAPVCEELLYRGALLPFLERVRTPVFALVASSLLFALAHAHYGPYLLALLGVGLTLGWARLASGRLAASMLLHATFNGAQLLLALYAAK
jgi:membrane protease YdiL (CAAX protease family)